MLMMRASGIPKISAEIAEFWKTLVATLPVFELPPRCGSGKKQRTPFLSTSCFGYLLLMTSFASQAVTATDTRVPFVLTTRQG